jgi:hypothetical protein
VNEHIRLAIVRRDEAEAAGAVEEFHHASELLFRSRSLVFTRAERTVATAAGATCSAATEVTAWRTVAEATTAAATTEVTTWRTVAEAAAAAAAEVTTWRTVAEATTAAATEVTTWRTVAEATTATAGATAEVTTWGTVAEATAATACTTAEVTAWGTVAEATTAAAKIATRRRRRGIKLWRGVAFSAAWANRFFLFVEVRIEIVVVEAHQYIPISLLHCRVLGWGFGFRKVVPGYCRTRSEKTRRANACCVKLETTFEPFLARQLWLTLLLPSFTRVHPVLGHMRARRS